MNYRIIRKIFAPLVNVLWPTTIINRQKFTQSKGVYVCNHYSIMDANPMCVQLFSEDFRFVIKEEVCKGVLGKFLDGIGAIPIKRGENDLRAIKECMNTLKQNKALLMFPEGTRNKDQFSKEMLEIKDGAAVFAIKAKAPIVPMLYYRSTKLFRRTYLIIGDSIDTVKYAGMTLNESRDLAAEEMRIAFLELRNQIDSIVENKSKLKAAKKSAKIEKKRAKLAEKRALKLSKAAKKSAIIAEIDKDN